MVENLAEYFKKYGNVQKAYIIFDPKTNKNKDFGFIEFEDPKSADLAFQDSHHLIGTCMVTAHRYGKRRKLQIQAPSQTSGGPPREQDQEGDKAEYIQKSKKKKRKKKKRKNPGDGAHKKSTRRFNDAPSQNHLEAKPKSSALAIPLEQTKDRNKLKIETTNADQNARDANAAAQEQEEQEEDDTPNQDSSENKYADLVKNLEIYTEKDRKTRLREIVELSLLKQSEEEYYTQAGVDVAAAYRVNSPGPGDALVDNGAY